MSNQPIEAFWQKVRQDSALQRTVGDKFQGEQPLEQIVALGKHHGSDFTVGELSEYLRTKVQAQVAQKAAGELSDEALETVAGGVGDLVVNINIENLNLASPGAGSAIPAPVIEKALGIPAGGCFPAPSLPGGW